MSDESFELRLDDDLGQYQQRPVVVYLASPLTCTTRRAAARNESIRHAVVDVMRESSHAFFDVYDPGDFTAPGSEHSPGEVYLTNYRRTVGADLMLLHVNSPSCGLGIEAQIGANACLPCVLIHPADNDVSRMLLGMPVSSLATIAYSGVRDFRNRFADVLPDIARNVTDTLPRRRRLREDARDAALGQFILKQRLLQGLTRSELSDSALVPENWVDAIEKHDECAIGISATQWHQMAQALGCQVRMGNYPVPRLEQESPSVVMTETIRASLESLVEFVRRFQPRNEGRVIRMWRDYREMQSEALAGRDPLNSPQTVDDWEELYGAHDELF